MVKDIEVKNTLMKTKFDNIHFGFASQTSKEVVLRVFLYQCHAASRKKCLDRVLKNECPV